MSDEVEIVLAAIKLLGPCTFGTIYGYTKQEFDIEVKKARQAILELWDRSLISVGSDRLVRAVE